MVYYLVKIVITAILVVLISEIAKRSTFVGAIIASIPLTSVMAMIWLYHDTHDVGKISLLASGIFWLVLPSLAMFIALPLLLKQGMGFYPGLGISMAITISCYWLMLEILAGFGIKL